MADPEPKKIIDVSHPKDFKPSATSKPVIVGHTNVVQRDPMMSPTPSEDEAPVTEANEDTLQSKPKRELKIQPLSESETEALDSPPVSTGVEESNSNIEQPKGTDDSVQNNEDTGDGAIDAIVEGINTKKEATEAREAEEKLNNEINELTSSKKYFVKVSDTPSRRNAKIFLWLIILLLIAGAGWYFGIGPGKDSLPGTNKTTKSNNLPTQSQTSTEKPSTDKAKNDNLINFSNENIKLTFSYPKSWQADVAKDEEYNTRDVITLSSPASEIDVTNEDGSTTKAGVFLRTKIFVENTKNQTEYKSDVINMTNCATEDIIMNNTPLKLAYLDQTMKAPSVSQVSVVTDNCAPVNNGLFGANDQIQFSSKANTYVIYTEYVYTKDYLNHQGVNDEDVIKTTQTTGIKTTMDAFKANDTYKHFIDMLKTLKEI